MCVSVCACLCSITNLVGLLSIGGVSLGVLVGLQEQIDQSRNGPGLSHRRLIGWAQCQVPNQTNGSLQTQTHVGGVVDINNNKNKLLSIIAFKNK